MGSRRSRTLGGKCPFVFNGYPVRMMIAVEILCADCGCLVDRGVRITVCDDVNCCCRDLPVREASS